MDTVYTLISYIQHNHDNHKNPTYVFFGDLQTAFPSTFKQQLLFRLAQYGITGQLWQQLRALHLHHKVRVLHGHIPSSSFVNIEKGLPEGGRLSPLEWCLYIADLVHDLQRYFPHISLSPPQHLIFMDIILFIDDLCLIAHSP